MLSAAPLCGFLNLLKPPGCSSAAAVGYVRRLLGGVKAGHAGTLDPEAAGVLPVMVGKAARLFDDLQDKEKAYVAEVAFGVATDTQDAQGRAIAVGDRYPDAQALAQALRAFEGEQWQTPPSYSAVKQDGKRLYQLARAGVEAQAQPRRVVAHELRLMRMTGDHGALLSVRCSKGFYVRTLCHDLGRVLGCPAHLRFLLRTQSGPFTLETALPLEEVARRAREGRLRLIPPETALSRLPCVQAPAALAFAARTGQTMPWRAFAPLLPPEAAQGAPFFLRLDGELLGVAVRMGDGVRLRTWLGA